MTADPKRYRSQTTLTMRGAEDGLPAGVCGQVEGIALVYGVIDTYGTTFARGCLTRTVRERVAAGKVRLFLDHGDVPQTGMYDTHLHIGTVREVVDEQGPDGKWQARFRADLFDTVAGRSAHEYLQAVAATGSETGVSIGMLKEPSMVRCVVDGQEAFRIDEVALGEISVTSMSSVPGTRVTAVRADVTEDRFDKVSNIIGGPVTYPDNYDPFDPQRIGVSRTADVTLSTSDYLHLLDGIVAHIGAATVRAHLSATVSNADDTSSSAATASDDATDTDSQGVSPTGTEPDGPNVAPYEDRLAFVRANLHRLL